MTCSAAPATKITVAAGDRGARPAPMKVYQASPRGRGVDGIIGGGQPSNGSALHLVELRSPPSKERIGRRPRRMAGPNWGHGRLNLPVDDRDEHNSLAGLTGDAEQCLPDAQRTTLDQKHRAPRNRR